MIPFLIERALDCNPIFFEHHENLVQRDRPVAIYISLLEDVPGFLLSYGRTGHFEKLEVIFEGKLLIEISQTLFLQKFVKCIFIELNVDAKFGHDALHFVLKFLVLVGMD